MLRRKQYDCYMERFAGYEVEKIEGGKSIAYKLHGKRGAVIRLVRNTNNPEMMFAMNAMGKQIAVDRSEWFTDASGSIRTVAVAR